MSHSCPQTPDGWTDGRLRDFIFCPMHMHCMALDRQKMHKSQLRTYNFTITQSAKFLLTMCNGDVWIF